ncbi:growth arrest and DNA damage-inducible proteins-interacting protein CRIF isoform X2 [Oratosquilla oratoria]|uniref:growth arrest and DNA damage-inducible proteins-interacting protein CRIF isoform X2 n=1 Tax=Oratosquilla oratoria TaxID=337810 RepID=UPI003F7640B4
MLILFDEVIHLKPSTLDEIEEQVIPVRSQRRQFGRHGLSSGINPAILWPSKEELSVMKEWESLAYPDSVQVMINRAKIEIQEEEEQIMRRQETIMAKFAKLDGWKQEVLEKRRKREEEAQKAKEKKQQRIDEVRQIFGFHIDPRDERFKEALEQKEKEERKAAKEAKKLERQKKVLERMSQIIARENAKAKDKDAASQSLQDS